MPDGRTMPLQIGDQTRLAHLRRATAAAMRRMGVLLRPDDFHFVREGRRVDGSHLPLTPDDNVTIVLNRQGPGGVVVDRVVVRWQRAQLEVVLGCPIPDSRGDPLTPSEVLLRDTSREIVDGCAIPAATAHSPAEDALRARVESGAFEDSFDAFFEELRVSFTAKRLAVESALGEARGLIGPPAPGADPLTTLHLWIESRAKAVLRLARVRATRLADIEKMYSAAVERSRPNCWWTASTSSPRSFAVSLPSPSAAVSA